MAPFLLVRDHLAHDNAIEIGWRTRMAGGRVCDGDLIWAYHASLERMLEWARQPEREWRDKMPAGIIDVRNRIILPENKLFGSVPELARLTYYWLDSGPINRDVERPDDPEYGMWIARQESERKRRVLTAAISNIDNGGPSLIERLKREKMERLNSGVAHGTTGAYVDDNNNVWGLFDDA